MADRLPDAFVNDDGGSDDDFVNGYENPMAWVKRHKVRADRLSKDVLFDNVDMRNITLDQYDGREKTEFVKWKLFGYNIVITYEYISKGETYEALEVICVVENILSSIGRNDPFLISIFNALQHITLSTKGHVLKLCGLETEFLKPIIMPNEMNLVNKAGLYGVQAAFLYEYDLTYAQMAKVCALKAISLNEYEAEWHYLLSKVITHWKSLCGNFNEYSKQEIEAAKEAVKLGKNDVYKLHLVHVYQRLARNPCMAHAESKNRIFDEGLQLLNEVIKNNTHDFLLLKTCLQSLSKFSLEKPNNSSINELLENLIIKLKLSTNGYVHGAIGNYYLHNKKDFKMASFHLKKAYDSKSFGGSFDYIYSLYRIDPNTTQVEPLLVDMLKSFSHYIHQEKILSQLVSYLMITKNDLFQALKYVPKLLNLKNVTCIRNLQKLRVKFSTESSKPFNLIDVLSVKLNAALINSMLTEDHAKKVAEVFQMLEFYKELVSGLMKEKEDIFGNDSKRNVLSKKSNPFSRNNDSKESWSYKNPKENTALVKSIDEGNWRSLKPDSATNSNVFSRGYVKQISNSGVENKYRFNFK